MTQLHNHFDNANVPQRFKAVTLKDAHLCRSVGGGKGADGNTIWQPTPLVKPFAFDFGTLQHGWVMFQKGQRATWDLIPATQAWNEETRDGWVHAAQVLIASIELNGVATLECTNRDLGRSIYDLYNRYVGYRNANADKIPVVRQEVDPITAFITFEIKSWIQRPSQFGERLNPVRSIPDNAIFPPLPVEETKDRHIVSGGNHSAYDEGMEPKIYEMLRQKQEAGRKANG